MISLSLVLTRFLKLGAATVAYIRKIAVDKKQWLDELANGDRWKRTDEFV
jgi:chromate transport protein ChrA